MERNLLQQLMFWKNKPNRKPLIIRGARQVGKTWLMKEFGKREYAQTAYVNFESSKSSIRLFLSLNHYKTVLLKSPQKHPIMCNIKLFEEMRKTDVDTNETPITGLTV
jgi:predicted AAA+ superfamily ATPase